MLYISYASSRIQTENLRLFLVYTARVTSKGWGTPGSALSGDFLTDRVGVIDLPV